MHETRLLPQPHDLLWGMCTDRLDAAAPTWAAEVLAAGRPVVVRRAPARDGWIAVGVRGHGREQRHAAWMPRAAIRRRVQPEQLTGGGEREGVCAPLRALALLQPQLDALCRQRGLAWGVTGGAGYQLATGVTVLGEHSDLDLLLRVPRPLERRQALALLERLEQLPCRVDLQLETPAGAVALREWAGSASQVLLKACSGARLVGDPWREVAA
ncbi:phosphoribosyl-dephospho-CoA transferase [Azotobacter beijerinckii]|uniref:Phosphoribosyl-dephospho-CoA transferase n=1 Tax=Azotobacter beijerinckii TaxID=170623 RepID=A0A1H6RI07_9GAMM|nr:malonate decarboxylase holo-ACP synthase [Azotobacter beijerinckii]SEI52944.1 phosphoribosyl-dephospho-CoA transferase [Azotobacter beijerinckii]